MLLLRAFCDWFAFISGIVGALTLKYINESVVRGDGNEGATAVRHYKKWCIARGDRIHRPLDPLVTSLAVKQRELLRICQFAVWLCHAFKIRVSTARDYISTCNAWHRRRNLVGFAADADGSIINECLKGLARTHIPSRPTLHRIGITAHHLALGMDIALGKRGECSPCNQNLRAALAVSFAGLFRGCEVCFQDNKQAKFQYCPTRAHIVALDGGSKGIRIREAKRTSLRDITPYSDTTVEFYPGGTFIDAVAELVCLSRLDPAPPEAPLFRDSRRQQLRVSVLRDTVKRIAAAVGLDPSFFGAHSLRCVSVV